MICYHQYTASGEGLQAFSLKAKNICLTVPPKCCIITDEQVELSRTVMPKGRGMRKVRASQGRITDNVRRRRLPGKCNRNKPPRLFYRRQGCLTQDHDHDYFIVDRRLEFCVARRSNLRQDQNSRLWAKHSSVLSKAVVVRMERRGKSSPTPMAT